VVLSIVGLVWLAVGAFVLLVAAVIALGITVDLLRRVGATVGTIWRTRRHAAGGV
jgi:hypothetical protein